MQLAQAIVSLLSTGCVNPPPGFNLLYINIITAYLVLPESHPIIRSPAKNKAKHQHTGHFDCLDSGLANYSLAAEGCTIDMSITGPLVYHGDDGDVAPKHHHQGHDKGHGQHKKEVEKLLNDEQIKIKKLRQGLRWVTRLTYQWSKH